MNPEERNDLLEKFDEFCKTYAKGVPYCIKHVFERDKEEIVKGVRDLYQKQDEKQDDKSNYI